MEKEEKTTGYLKWLSAGLTGLLLGACLALMLLAGIVIGRSQAANSLPTPTRYVPHYSTPTDTPVPSETPIPLVTITVTDAAVNFDQAFGDADQAAQNGDLDQAQQLFLALLAQTNDLSKTAEIYGRLGDIKMNQGHSSLASAYYDKQYALQKAPLTLMKMADAYSESGNLIKAESGYMELLNWPNKEADSYLEDAREKLKFVRLMLGTPIATTPETGQPNIHPAYTPKP